MYHSDFGRRLRSQSSGASSSSQTLLDGRLSSSPSSGRISGKSLVSGSSSPFGGSDKARANVETLERARPRSSSRNGRSNSMSERPRTPRKGGDRFIPNRENSDDQKDAFQLMASPPSTPHRSKRKITGDADVQKEEANQTFSTLLSSELFGVDSVAYAQATGSNDLTSSPTVRASGSSSPSRSSHPATPTKKNIYSHRSPSSSRSRSIGTPGRSGESSGRIGLYPGVSLPKSPGRSLFAGSVSDSNLVESLDSPRHAAYNVSPVKMESQRLLSSPRRVHRVLSKVPYKVLDAPELADDYYLNLVDWSSADVLGVGLGHCVYLWSAKTSGVTKLCDLKENRPEADKDKVMGISWSGQGNYLAVGTQNGKVQIWDPETLKCIRTMAGHKQRVGALAWNEHILTSGSRDRSIFHRDVRVPQQSIRELKGHKQEVCGLKWNTMTNQLASGGNDNKLYVWDGLGTSALHQFAEHTAAVKAIAWSPHQQGLLASGGGTADMKIKYWNTVTGAKLSEVDTGSQVCNLAWSKTSNEIISTHGFSSGKVHNQVQIWRYPGMQQVASLTGHTMRVLYLAMSPDGETIVSGAGDETLRFWNLNTPAKKLIAAETSSALNPFARLR